MKGTHILRSSNEHAKETRAAAAATTTTVKPTEAINGDNNNLQGT